MTTAESRAQQQIERNIRVHNRMARQYEAVHGEIFNDVEQARLVAALERARDAIRRGSRDFHALDFGCGSGNLSRHLLDLGLRVTSADVSSGFLDLVKSRYASDRLATLLLDGRGLENVPDESYDLVATYSVLHHIPDYLAIIEEFARVCTKGGVILLDHELNERHWQPSAIHRRFRSEVNAPQRWWTKYLRPSNYVNRIVRLFNPRYSREGDIHVWPDDHIEWAEIIDTLSRSGCEIVVDQDYLLYDKRYPMDLYSKYAENITDMKLVIARKI